MDTVPHISAAGYKPPTDSNSTASCVQPDLEPHNIAPLNATLASFTLHAAAATSPATLAAIDPHYKYRRTFQTQPGLRFIHPALTHQHTAHGPHSAHGITTKQTLTAADVLASASASAASSPLARFIHEQKEATYASNRMAPLGASLVRGHVLPSATLAPDFRYGVSTKRGDDAKQLIYSPTPTPPTATAEERTVAASTGYYATHRQASTKALTRQEERQITRPVDRHYDWSATSAPINPATYTFGLPPPPTETQQVKRALTFEPEEKETVVMSSKVEQHDRRKSRVGEVRAISDERVRILHASEQFRFGLSSERDEWDAKQTLRGSYSTAEQQPDADLGRTQQRRGRSDEEEQRAADDARTFGLPSIRHDRTAPTQKSVANVMNYGDEGSSKQLLYPPPYACFGLQDEHWLQERPSAELRSLYERMGVRMKDRQWDVICRRAVALYGALSVDSVRHAINRQEMERACTVCGAIQCQHTDCVHRMCAHDGLDGLGNHRRFMAHERQYTPLKRPAGATGTGYTPVGEKAVSR